MTFGSYISEKRKKRGLTQKELAGRIIKSDDNKPISAQYLNDIEHDRRSPSSSDLIEQLARELQVDEDYLYFLAGRLPADITSRMEVDPGTVSEAMRVFRKRSSR
jgi:transcriptional regulator with XRE-family HTH domain